MHLFSHILTFSASDDIQMHKAFLKCLAGLSCKILEKHQGMSELKCFLKWFQWTLTNSCNHLNTNVTSWPLASEAEAAPLIRFRSKLFCLYIWRHIGVEALFLHLKRCQLRWFGSLIKMSPGCFPLEILYIGQVQLVGDSAIDTEHTWGIIYCISSGLVASWKVRNCASWDTSADRRLDYIAEPAVLYL